MYFLRIRYFLTGLVVLQALFALLIKPPKEKMLVSDAANAIFRYGLFRCSL